MEERTYCVYQIYNKTEKKNYIGSTCHFDKRIKAHKRGKHKWQIDFATHTENWEIHVLEDNIDEKNISERELYYIDLYDSIDNGYNRSYIGNIQTTETRLKISKAERGKFVSDETRKKLSEAGKGKSISEETRQKIKNKLKGHTPWNKGKSISEETRNKLKGHTPWNKGKTGIYSEETKKKMSEALKNPSEETRQKMRDAKIGYVPINKGRICINNGINNKYINPDDLQKYIDLGYIQGGKAKK